MENENNIPKPPIPPHELPQTPHLERQTIDVVGEDLTAGSVNIRKQNREENPVQTLIENKSINLFEYIMEFEEDHPWIFFIGIALIIFIIVGGIISLFFRNDLNIIPDDLFSFSSSEEEITDEEEPIKEELPTTITVMKALEGIKNSFALNTAESYDKLVFKGDSETFLADDIVLVQKMNTALEINIQNELSIIKDEEQRLKYLTDYLNYIIYLEENGAENYMTLSTLIDNTEKERQYYETKKTEAKEKVTEIFSTAGPNELAEAIKISNEYENKYDVTENKLIFMQQVFSTYPSPLQVLQARIAAIRANKEILLLGLTIFPIDQAGLDLMNAGTATDWYESKAPIKNVKKKTSIWGL